MNYASQKAGTTSTFSPGPITRSAPLAQTESFNNSLNVTFSARGAVHRQILPLTHSQGTPRSQLRPGPWPRRKTALPKPTSILASMVVALGADTADFCPGPFLSSTATVFGAGAGGVTAIRAKGRAAAVLASFTLAAIVETFAAAGAGIETGAAGLGASAFLTSIEESWGAFFSSGVAGEENSAARLGAGEVLVFLMVSFTEFVFMFIMFT